MHRQYGTRQFKNSGNKPAPVHTYTNIKKPPKKRLAINARKHPRLAYVTKLLQYTRSGQTAVRLGILGVMLLIIVQVFYPGDRLLPLARVDGIHVGGKTKTEAAKALNDAYASKPVDIYLGGDKKPFRSPALKELASVNNADRMNGLQYPFFLRIIPTSILWATWPGKAPAPSFSSATDAYIEKTLMPECRKAPTDASLKENGATFTVIGAVSGGKCDVNDVAKTVRTIQPNLQVPTQIRVALTQVPAQITSEDAKDLSDRLTKRLAKGVPLMVNGKQTNIVAKAVTPWLDFASQDGMLVVKTNVDRMQKYMNEAVVPQIAVKPGVSRITTKDFEVISKQEGSPGKGLDSVATARSIDDFLGGTAANATAVAKVLPPLEEYTRSYSDTDAGLNALLTNFTKDHSGSFGVSFAELDGKKRRASVNGDKQYVTASTYKLFVAYSVLKQVDEGRRNWDNTRDCFDRMISQSDNACAESFLNELGTGNTSRDIANIGLKNSNFTQSGGPYTTADDLALFMGMLQAGQNFSSIGQTRLLNALKNNVYRNGIPAGATGDVADKVGFMDGLLHDAAIVYNPKGTYILAVMSNGSSWQTIADLTRQLDQLHSQ